jgi:hypothetical protein
MPEPNDATLTFALLPIRRHDSLLHTFPALSLARPLKHQVSGVLIFGGAGAMRGMGTMPDVRDVRGSGFGQRAPPPAQRTFSYTFTTFVLDNVR